MREYFANLLVIALSVAFLAHFSLIVIYKHISYQEPNSIILGLEIVILICFIAFAIVNIRHIKRSK